MNYEEILSRFTYDDETEIEDRIVTVKRDDYRENRDIINEIVLWKVNRRPRIADEVIDAISDLDEIKSPAEAIQNAKTEQALSLLLASKGMKLPMASTVLHFYYPEIYPIIDQRAYRELYGMEYPRTVASISTLSELYIKYMKDCYQYWQDNCPQIPFAKVDKILYQLDKEKGYQVKY